MIDTYWDFYIAYIAKCVRENYANDIDPHHYEMEWNHFLPQCLFGDQPVGHWLTLKQHAIASALQTLSFQKNCMTGMMKKYLPAELLEIAWPLYGQKGELNPCFGRTGELNPMYGRTGELHPLFGKKNPAVSERMKLRTGELHPMFGKKRPDVSERMKLQTGELHPKYGKKDPAGSERMKLRTGELHPNYSKKWWVNSEGKTYMGVEAPNSNWQQGRKWKD